MCACVCVRVETLRNTLVVTKRCRKGEVVFRSDNMSTVSVLREVLSKETALKKVAVKFTHGQSPNWRKFCVHAQFSWPEQLSITPIFYYLVSIVFCGYNRGG